MKHYWYNRFFFK